MTTIAQTSPIHWNPFNEVVQDHRDGTVDIEATNIERVKRGLAVPWDPSMAPGAPKPTLEDHIRMALNKFSAENGSDTPDFILAQYLMGCLDVWNGAVIKRERWWGRPQVTSEFMCPTEPNSTP